MYSFVYNLSLEFLMTFYNDEIWKVIVELGHGQYWKIPYTHKKKHVGDYSLLLQFLFAERAKQTYLLELQSY